MAHSRQYLDRLKWLLLATFPIGYSLTFSLFRDNPVEYFVYTLAVACSCYILLLHIRLFEQHFVATWMVFILFVLLYFIRFYWIALDPTPVRDMLPWNPYKAMVESRVSQLQAFKLSVLAFVSFNLATTAFVLYARKVGAIRQAVACSTWPVVLAKKILIAITLLAIFLAYLTYKFNIGEMGVSSGEPLPFRLKGVIFYARMVVVPLVILVGIYLAEQSGSFITSRVGVSILIVNGIADMMLRSSRSGLLLALVLMAFLILADGIKLRRKEKMIFVMLLPLAFILVPFMTEYRYIRMNSSLPHLEAFSGSLEVVKNKGLGQVLKGLQFVMFRMPGVESLWCMIAARAEPLGLHSIEIFGSKNGIAGYLTTTIYPMKVTDNTLLAPGFVGWFYLVGGAAAVVTGSILAGICSLKIWELLDKKYLATGPVAKVFFLWMLFLAFTEGTLDSMLYLLFAGLVTMTALEIGMRQVDSVKPSSFRRRF